MTTTDQILELWRALNEAERAEVFGLIAAEPSFPAAVRRMAAARSFAPEPLLEAAKRYGVYPMTENDNARMDAEWEHRRTLASAEYEREREAHEHERQG